MTYSFSPRTLELRAGLVTAVALALGAGVSACGSTCELTEDTTFVRVPGPWCTEGKCEAWRDGPCAETCAAFLGRAKDEILSCTQPSPERAGSATWTLRCSATTETCTKAVPMPHGRPQLHHVARGAASGDEVGRFFAAQAEAEESSVFAFEELAAFLTAREGGGALARACERAAREEERHRRALTRLARRRGATPSRAIPAPSRWSSPAELALENAAVGRVDELWSAAITAYAAAAATDLEVRRRLAAIAEEEAGHAALAEDLEAFLTPTLTTEEGAAVRDVRRRAVAVLATRVLGAPLAPALEAEGLVPPRRARLVLFAAVFGDAAARGGA